MTNKQSRRWKRTALMLLAALMALVGGCGEGPLRLHVVANSDSGEDQQVKMEVREAVLEVTKEGIAACQSAKEAEEYIIENIEIIEATANETLEKNGLGYTAQAGVGISHFPDREYNGVCYPEGDYHALRVVLGDGKGRNWWCVMFPPLCISELDADADEAQYTSFLAEFFGGLFEQP